MNQKKYVVVVGVDYSPASSLALDQALSISSSKEHAHVHVVYVRSAPDSSSSRAQRPISDEDALELELYVTRRLSAFREQHDKAPYERLFNHLRSDDPGHQIAQLAADVEADLVVVGTHDRTGVARFLLGSVADTVTRVAPCPVLVVRPKAVQAPAPTVKPPCARCVEVRRATNCAELWCEQHGERHARNQDSGPPEPTAAPPAEERRVNADSISSPSTST